MALAPTRLTLEEFLELPEEKPALEFVDGEVTQKVSPKLRHGILQGELVRRINDVALPARLARAVPELRVTFGGHSYVPDISICRWERIPVTADGLAGDDLTEAPDAVIEIVSPRQSVNALVRRCLGYVAGGVHIALLVDPADRSVLAFRPGRPAIAWHEQDLIELAGLLPTFQLTVTELFETLRQE